MSTIVTASIRATGPPGSLRRRSIVAVLRETCVCRGDRAERAELSTYPTGGGQVAWGHVRGAAPLCRVRQPQTRGGHRELPRLPARGQRDAALLRRQPLRPGA